MYWKKLEGRLSPYLAAFCFGSKKRLIDWWLSLVNRIGRTVHAMATNYWSALFSNLSPLGTIQSLNPSSDYLEVTSVNHQIKLIKLSSFFVGLLATLFRIVGKFSVPEHTSTITRQREWASLANVSLIQNHRDFMCFDGLKLHKKLWMEMCFSFIALSLNTVNQTLFVNYILLSALDGSFWIKRSIKV